MHDAPLITTIATAFTMAWLMGLLTQRLRMSPIIGYLLAGVAVGSYTPGFVGNLSLAQQLADVGVVLLMFGVGLNFQLRDLLAVRSVVIPGAITQSTLTTLLAMAVFNLFGLPLTTSAVIGMAMAVSSTVVLMRVVMDANALNTPAGHVAVGWTVLEDILTVIALVMLPVLASIVNATGDTNPIAQFAWGLAVVMVKLVALVAVVIGIGSKVIPWVLLHVARLRSRELFTLTILVFSIAIATGVYFLFGVSMALGAFLAGLVVAQSPASHQAAADALPLRDAFSVLFFVAVGMLFDPSFLLREPAMMAVALAIILLFKSTVALFIVIVLGHSVRTALTVAIGVAQIGEFSFILSEMASQIGLMPDSGRHLLVGGAIVSIILNPILFRAIDKIEHLIQRRPRLRALLNTRGERKAREANAAIASTMNAAQPHPMQNLAIIVGYGPVGQAVDRHLRDAGVTTVIVDTNLDTTIDINRQGQTAIFGDASHPSILEIAGGKHASYLVLTLPQTASRVAIISAARALNPNLLVFVRARYLREREELELLGVTAAVFEEAEAAVELARLVLTSTGAGSDSIKHAVREIRTRLILDNVTNLHRQQARDIMIPWTRVRRLTTSANLDTVRRQVSQQRFSRWPVVHADTADVTGYLLVKDLIGYQPDQGPWTTLIRPLLDLPADADIESALQEFQRRSATIGVVRDHGRPVGLLTMEDILEQLIGRLEDEYPRRQQLTLPDLIYTDHALLNLTSQTATQAITDMATRLPPERLPPGVDVAALAIERERQFPTDVGFGVAVPHARCPRLLHPCVVFGRALHGVAFDPHSTEPVRLIFLLVTPVEHPDMQIQVLSRVATIAGDPAIRAALLAANTPADVRAALPTDPAPQPANPGPQP